ncbi:MAG: division/cell wall cluster transcriptional repressor MraZ [Clostridiaceae bacterium]|nr:division/cell wall cluster transcriptional repressor MraZ [Clostridiaceae bacterium]
MLIGEYRNTLDAKGRVIIPAAFRYDLGDRFILAKGIEKCLNIYPEEEWFDFVQKLQAAMPSSRKENRKAIRFFSSNATVCELDKQGRILIPNKMREYAGLDKELLFIGGFNKVEIWNPDNYEDSEAEEIGSILEELNIKY